MLIRMLSTHRGAADGFTLREYKTGEQYDLSGAQRAVELAQLFVREGWAEQVKAQEPAQPEPPKASAPLPPPAQPMATAPSPAVEEMPAPQPAATPVDRPRAKRQGR